MRAPVVDRYLAHGLKHNPFAFDVAELHEVFVERGLPTPPPANARVLVQLIGAKGFGKTTQLHAWRRQRPGPYCYVPPGSLRQRWLQPPVAGLVYADEIDRLPPIVRMRWFRQLANAQATVVAGTHQDLAAPARRCGLSVITHNLDAVDLETLRRIVDAKVRAAQQTTAELSSAFAITDEELRGVHERSHGSVRIAERHLHELLAARVRGS